METGDLRARFRLFVADRKLLAPGDAVVVGVSGGVDSVVLLHLLRDDFRPHVVHLNYGLRPEADDDASFVAALAEAWRVPVEVFRIALTEGENVQSEARESRYKTFENSAMSAGAEAVAVGHQRDDVAETLLLHLLRGAGPRGWAALPVRRPLRRESPVEIVRPLRFAHRWEIEAFARAEGLRWREDASNQTLKYRRNVLRQAVVPLLEEHFGPGAAARLADAAERMEAYLETGASLAAGADFEEARLNERGLSLERLDALPEPARLGVLLEALRQWVPEAPRSAAVVREVDGLLAAQPGKRVALPGTDVWRERDRLRFVVPEETEFSVTVTVGESVDTPWGTLQVESCDQPPERFGTQPELEFVDAASVGGPLRLRTWRPGDRFQPLGMEGHKNVSDLLTERAVPPGDRARQLVLTAGEEVVWVVGHRLAEPFRVPQSGSAILRLEWVPRSRAERSARP